MQYPNENENFTSSNSYQPLTTPMFSSFPKQHIIKQQINLKYKPQNKFSNVSKQNYAHYYPYQRKNIQYQDIEQTQYIPREVKYIEYEQRTKIKTIPNQKKYLDYYTVQHITQFVPKIISQTYVQYMPVQRIQDKIEYYPVQKSYLQNPNNQNYFRNNTNHLINNNNVRRSFKQQQMDYIAYRQLPSYPIYHPNLHKILPSNIPLRSHEQYLTKY